MIDAHKTDKFEIHFKISSIDFTSFINLLEFIVSKPMCHIHTNMHVIIFVLM